MPEHVSDRLAAVRLQKEEMELEIMQEQVAQMRGRKLQAAQDRTRQTRDIEDAERTRAAAQAICTHRKGGKDRDALVKGNDANYAVITHTYPTGQVEVSCQRCAKLWVAPSPELKKTDPKAYRDQEREYREARAFPTDNTPSGKRLFAFERVA